MGKSSHPARPTSPTSLGLGAFRDQIDDQGMSLEQAEHTMRVTNPKGLDPYAQLPDPVDDIWPEADAAAAEHLGTHPDPCPLTPQSILEALLFVGHPEQGVISPRYVAALMRGVRPTEIDALVEELNAAYLQEGAPYRIESVGQGYRLALNDIHMSLRDVFQGKVKEARLAQGAIDALAIVAYHQPITRDELDRVSEACTSRTLAQLVRRGLIWVDRERPEGGRPVYRTTSRFLEIFGLASLEDLPRGQEADLD